MFRWRRRRRRTDLQEERTNLTFLFVTKWFL